jgi:hypothetical protein
LDQIEAHEGGEPEPVWVNPMGQGEAGQNERSSDDADSGFDFHGLQKKYFRGQLCREE